MADLPSNAFDGEAACPFGKIELATTEQTPAQLELIIKAAKAADDPGKRKSECNLRLEKESPNPANPAAPLVTRVSGDIGKGLGMRKSVSLAANQRLFMRCTKVDQSEENDSLIGGDDVCRFTVTYLR